MDKQDTRNGEKHDRIFKKNFKEVKRIEGILTKKQI